jgi:hypothetical protein
MEIRSTDIVPHPVDEVYRTFRDRMPEITQYIRNVDRIVVEKREELGKGKVHLINHWYAVGEIPPVARSVVKPDMLSWRDDATWDDSSRTATWKLETFFFRESVRCYGTTRFAAKGDGGTEVRIEGNLEIRVIDLPMVPGLLKKKVSAEIERFVAALIGPNLKNATVGVQKFLDANSPRAASATPAGKPAAKKKRAGS